MIFLRQDLGFPHICPLDEEDGVLATLEKIRVVFSLSHVGAMARNVRYFCQICSPVPIRWSRYTVTFYTHVESLISTLYHGQVDGYAPAPDLFLERRCHTSRQIP